MVTIPLEVVRSGGSALSPYQALVRAYLAGMTHQNSEALAPQPTKMVSYSKKKTNHVLHLILSVLTAGLWIPVWIGIAVVNSMRKEKTTTRPAY